MHRIRGENPNTVPKRNQPPDTSPILDTRDAKLVQQVLGRLLYYAVAVDIIMLAAISSKATQQANSTITTLQAITHFSYCATRINAKVRFVASDMVFCGLKVLHHIYQNPQHVADIIF